MSHDKPSPMPTPKDQVAQVTRPDPPPTAPDNPVKEPTNSGSPTVSVPPQPAPSAPEPTKEATPVQPTSPERPQPHTVTINAGTSLQVRIGETLTADHNQPGNTFLATLDHPLIVDGFVLAERGARLEGRIVEAERAGRVKGLSHLAIELVRLSTADGQHIRIHTSPFQKEGQSSVGSDAAKIGIGAAIGAAIRGIAGAGKGPGIGAGVAGAAGAW